MTRSTLILLAALCPWVPAASALAQQFDVSIAPPVVDRWMYPFASEAGTRATAPVFSSANTCGTDDRFDDRDAQLLVTFATDASVPTGLPPADYQVQAVRVRIRTSDATPFFYDPTPDALATFLAPGNAAVPCPPDPEFMADSDPGRPIELFAVAFRNGFTAHTYGESSPFKPGGAFVPPWINVRNAYPVTAGPDGAYPVDASNPLKDRSLGRPLALGLAPGVEPGAVPPDGTEFVFEVDLTIPGALGYFQEGLAGGRIALLVTALFEAQEQTVGSYPTLYTREATPPLFPGGAPPRLELSVLVAAPCAADFNGDGFVNPDDLSDFITCFFLDVQFPGACAAADFNGDGFRDPDDLSDFITTFFLGCA